MTTNAMSASVPPLTYIVDLSPRVGQLTHDAPAP